ncbi:hypothetical protein Tco_0266117 [Tanacetum coccineum]
MPRYIILNVESWYLMPTLLSFLAVNNIRIARDKDADSGEVISIVCEVGFVVEARLIYCTPTCCKLNSGFLGLTARKTTRTTATTTSARNEKRRNKQQQQPLIEAEGDEVDEFG